MRTLWLLLVLLALPLTAARACECTLLEPDEVAHHTSLIFGGRVLALDKGQVLFDNKVTLKGFRVSRPRLALNGPNSAADCAVTFRKDEFYVVVARGNFEDGYYTDACLQRQMNENELRQRQIGLILGPTAQIGNDLMQVLLHDPADLATTRKLGDIYLAAGDAEQAAAKYRLAGDLSDHAPEDSLGEGEALLLLGPAKAKEALSRFDDVLEKDGQNKPAWHGRYRSLALQNRWIELPAENVDLSGLVLEGAEIGTNLTTPDLQKVWFDRIDAKGHALQRANFSDARIGNSSFAAADLTWANFSRARLLQSSFSKAKLDGANFSRARLNKLDFNGASLKGADFTGATLEGVDFTGADLTSAIWAKVSAKEVTWPKGFTPPKAE